MSQIVAVEAQLAQLRLIYTENHPEVRRLEVRLRGLQQGQAEAAPSIQSVQAQLAQRRLVYKDSHPEILRLEAQLKALQQREAHSEPK